MYDVKESHRAKGKRCGYAVTKKITLCISGATWKVAYDNIQNKTLKSTVILKCLGRHVTLKTVRY